MMGLLNHQRVGQSQKYRLEFNETTGQGGTGQAFDILSYWRPSLGRSAGARLTVIRRAGSASPDATRAARTRSRQEQLENNVAMPTAMKCLGTVPLPAAQKPAPGDCAKSEAIAEAWLRCDPRSWRPRPGHRNSSRRGCRSARSR